MLDDALSRLAALDARQGQIVELRFFGGLSVEETAAVMGVSERTIKREWQMSRAWLRREMSRTAAESSPARLAFPADGQLPRKFVSRFSRAWPLAQVFLAISTGGVSVGGRIRGAGGGCRDDFAARRMGEDVTAGPAETPQPHHPAAGRRAVAGGGGGQAGVSRRTVAIWRQRFVEGGPTTLQHDRPGPRPARRGAAPHAVAAIKAAMANPPAGHERWTARALAKHVGVSHSTVLRVWRDQQGMHAPRLPAGSLKPEDGSPLRTNT